MLYICRPLTAQKPGACCVRTYATRAQQKARLQSWYFTWSVMMSIINKIYVLFTWHRLWILTAGDKYLVRNCPPSNNITDVWRILRTSRQFYIYCDARLFSVGIVEFSEAWNFDLSFNTVETCSNWCFTWLYRIVMAAQWKRWNCASWILGENYGKKIIQKGETAINPSQLYPHWIYDHCFFVRVPYTDGLNQLITFIDSSS